MSPVDPETTKALPPPLYDSNVGPDVHPTLIEPPVSFSGPRNGIRVGVLVVGDTVGLADGMNVGLDIGFGHW